MGEQPGAQSGVGARFIAPAAHDHAAWLPAAGAMNRAPTGWSRLVALSVLFVSAASPCCFHDSNTLSDERQELPRVYDAVFGSYRVNCPEYYQRRLRLLGDDLNSLTATQLDDRAVAQARLGKLTDAAKALSVKDRRFPEQYTTWANLGAVLVQQRQWSEAAAALEHAEELRPEGQFQRDRYLLLLAKWQVAIAKDPKLATSSTVLGFDVGTKLGEGFRLTAPRGGDEEAIKLAQEHVLRRLELNTDIYDGLVDLLVSNGDGLAEPIYILAELLAARGDRWLAWHAYQRADDLRHPRSADIQLFQTQVAGALSPHDQRALSPARHWELRRRAYRWRRDFQDFQRKLIAAGGDPDDSQAYAKFEQEHPRP